MADVSFEADVKPLFTEMDRVSMKHRFDLWDVEDVREHAEAIHRSVENGSMPCTSPWPPEDVALLRSWIDGGMAD
jgi:hypothetical protein